MAVQAERLKISITEENRAIRALQEAAYIEGYMAAELREREKRQKARERQKERGISLPKNSTVWQCLFLRRFQ